ncbi:flagellum-specific ATP synthase FliI, partial [Roseburia faecis]|nr:flagellum-specific ATP synthase FliI [Roseburia faecis]
SIGDICYIHVDNKKNAKKIIAEVVGFRDGNVILMPYTNIQEISPGSLVEATGKPMQVKAGPRLLGKVI